MGWPYLQYARHVCRADGLKETLSPNQREDNP